MNHIKHFGVTLVDSQLNQPTSQIIDMIRDFHYKAGFNESQFPDYDTMVINLHNFLEEDFIYVMNNNLHQSGGILEHINDYYPQIANMLQDPNVKEFLNIKYLEMVMFLGKGLGVACDHLSGLHYVPSAIEKFNINSETSYYVVSAEPGFETYEATGL